LGWSSLWWAIIGDPASRWRPTEIGGIHTTHWTSLEADNILSWQFIWLLVIYVPGHWWRLRKIFRRHLSSGNLAFSITIRLQWPWQWNLGKTMSNPAFGGVCSEEAVRKRPSSAIITYCQGRCMWAGGESVIFGHDVTSDDDDAISSMRRMWFCESFICLFQYRMQYIWIASWSPNWLLKFSVDWHRTNKLPNASKLIWRSTLAMQGVIYLRSWKNLNVVTPHRGSRARRWEEWTEDSELILLVYFSFDFVGRKILSGTACRGVHDDGSSSSSIQWRRQGYNQN